VGTTRQHRLKMLRTFSRLRSAPRRPTAFSRTTHADGESRFQRRMRSMRPLESLTVSETPSLCLPRCNSIFSPRTPGPIPAASLRLGVSHGSRSAPPPNKVRFKSWDRWQILRKHASYSRSLLRHVAFGCKQVQGLEACGCKPIPCVTAAATPFPMEQSFRSQRSMTPAKVR
jgi:hypothetical protein